MSVQNSERSAILECFCAGKIQTICGAVAGIGLVWLSTATVPAHAQTAANANTIFSPLNREEVAEELQRSVTATRLAPQQYMREMFWRFSDDTPAFFRDQLMQVVGRTYYLTRENFDGTKSQAWAVGGWIAYRSGLIADTFGVHAAFYTSQRLYGPSDEGGTRLLTPENDPINVLGQVYGRIKFFDQEFRGGRQLVDTPLINPQDNRMVPNTFTGTVVTTLPDSKRNYDYAVGYLWDIKQRDSNDFIPMSDALLGSDTLNRGTAFGMIKYRPIAGLSTIFMDYYVPDFINAAFVQAEYGLQLPKDVPQWIIGANVLDQRTVGSTNLLAASPFNTYQASGKVQVTYVGWIAFVAGSITGNESKIYSPFGTKPNYTDMQQSSFDNAGEKAIGGSVAYDFGYAFKHLGLAGLTTGVWYSQGWGAINPTTAAAIADRDEWNVWLQYRPTEGPLKGLRLRTAFSNVQQSGNPRNNQPEFRMLADYTLLIR